jgi:anti-sigma factor RsiW
VSSRLTCRKLVELVTEYLEGTLPPDDRARFEEHLVKCDGCGAYVDQMRKTIALAGRVREQDIEPEAREKLMAAFRDWRARSA